MINNKSLNLDKEIIILGHERPDVDSIVSGFLLELLLEKMGILSRYVIPDQDIDQEIINICLSYNLDPCRFKQKIDLSNPELRFILVDHNERDLEGEIIAIIDHHPALNKVECKNYFNKISSSTSCVICKGHEGYFSKEELELAFLAAFVDTASFHSTKGTEEDKNWILDLCNKLGINYDNLYKTGLCLTSLGNITNASLNGLKKYNLNNHLVQSSYIQIENTLEEGKVIADIIKFLKVYLVEQNLDIFVFVVHDMSKFCSKVYQIYRDNVIEINYDQYTSRGNVIIPEVAKSLKK